MLKKLLSLMLLLPITSSIFCMKEPEQQNSLFQNQNKHQLKQLAKENKQQEIIELIEQHTFGSYYLNENYDLIWKYIEKFELDQVLKHIIDNDNLSKRLEQYKAEKRYKLIGALVEYRIGKKVTAKEDIDYYSGYGTERIALYAANGLSEIVDGLTPIMHVIKDNPLNSTNSYNYILEVINHLTQEALLQDDFQGKTILSYAIERLVKLMQDKDGLLEDDVNKRKQLDQQIQFAENIAASLVEKGLRWEPEDSRSLYNPQNVLYTYFKNNLLPNYSTNTLNGNYSRFKTAKLRTYTLIEKINAKAGKSFVKNKSDKSPAQNRTWQNCITSLWSKTTTKKIIAGGIIVTCLAGILYLAKGGKSENIAKNIRRN